MYSQVTVYAGNDQTICNNERLDLATLQARIAGSVTDGYWFTLGDGKFGSSNSPNAQFSTATFYTPGSIDKGLSMVKLLLVSLDPDGFGPLPQVVDTVKISLQGSIAIVCNTSLNVALGPECDQVITPEMLATNLKAPISYYTLSIKDAQHNVVKDNKLTGAHIGKQLEFSVGHRCGTNTCWGTIMVQDKLAPQLTCQDVTVQCGSSTDVNTTGFPFDLSLKKIKVNETTYNVTGLDACTITKVTLHDAYTKEACNTGNQAKIVRTWTATDTYGNSSYCNQSIYIKNKDITEIIIPAHMDGNENPHLECGGKWIALSNGYPSPESTGKPNTEGCTNLEYTYTDTKIDLCGTGYSIIRKWSIINWCGTIVKEGNQIIKVKDTQAPIFTCPKDTVIFTSPYACGTQKTRLPIPTQIKDCSSTTVRYAIRDSFTRALLPQYLLVEGKLTYVDKLPLGSYIITAIVEDACLNKDTCNFGIKVKDNAPPIAICDQFTKVSLTIDGTARLEAQSVDDGSHDNCTAVTYNLAKMQDLCGGKPLSFGPYVDFCCAESAAKQMVALKVSDAHGNSNTCMVEVTVEDKLSPKVTCPPNITIACTTLYDEKDLSLFGNVVVKKADQKNIVIQDFYNSGVIGQDGFVEDNCVTTITHTFSSSVKCYLGTISRTFEAKDAAGNTGKCTQTIFIQNPDPFEVNDISWPVNAELNGCSASQADKKITGEPTFKNTACATVAASYTDQVFTLIDEACIKIVRTWTVLDWCQFNENTGAGRWTKIQVIKLKNSIAPTIKSVCRDTLVCVLDEKCGNGKLVWTPTVEDDCTATNDMVVLWTIDADNDGDVDITGKTLKLDATLIHGKHKVSYTVGDLCGNKTSCSFIATVKDCKKPTPYCMTETTSVIMPSTGALVIRAKSFNSGSFDNCTPSNLLKFSFSENVGDSLKTLRCADIKNGESEELTLNMWVTDTAQNKDFCKVKFTIQDNSNACADIEIGGSIKGRVLTSDLSKVIKDAEVSVTVLQEDITFKKNTDSLGRYRFTGLFPGQDHLLKVNKNGVIAEGLSTLDLLLIQRHILDLSPLSNPYNIIAADVDKNQKINSTDLVAIRKVILSQRTVFPNESTPWAFIPKSYKFADPKQPLNYREDLIIDKLRSGTTDSVDFIAIKRGDVNHSTSQISGVTAQPRTSATLDLISSKVGSVHEVISEKDNMLYGFQLALNINQFKEGDIVFPSWMQSGVDYYYEKGILRMSFSNANGVMIKTGQMLFTLKNSVRTVALNTNWANEYYDEDLQPLAITLKEKSIAKPINMGESIITVVGKGDQVIAKNNTERNMVSFVKVYDVIGREIYTINNIYLQPGENELPVERSRLPLMAIVSLYVEDRVFSIKL
jgi:hypothetical protein